jgi:hypothetical protein
VRAAAVRRRRQQQCKQDSAHPLVAAVHSDCVVSCCTGLAPRLACTAQQWTRAGSTVRGPPRLHGVRFKAITCIASAHVVVGAVRVAGHGVALQGVRRPQHRLLIARLDCETSSRPLPPDLDLSGLDRSPSQDSYTASAQRPSPTRLSSKLAPGQASIPSYGRDSDSRGAISLALLGGVGGAAGPECRELPAAACLVPLCLREGAEGRQQVTDVARTLSDHAAVAACGCVAPRMAPCGASLGTATGAGLF